MNCAQSKKCAGRFPPKVFAFVIGLATEFVAIFITFILEAFGNGVVNVNVVPEIV